MARDLTEFNLAYGQAVEAAKSFPEAQFKTLASVFVIIGWLVTASTAQQFVHANAYLALLATAFALFMLVFFKAIWIRQHYKRSVALFKLLERLAAEQEISSEILAPFKPHPLVPATLFTLNAVACTACLVVLWLVSR